MVLPTPSPFRYDPAADEASEAADSRDPNPYLTLTPTLTPLTLTLTLTLALALAATRNPSQAGGGGGREKVGISPISPISRREVMAEAVGRIPRELRTVAQALSPALGVGLGR